MQNAKPTNWTEVWLAAKEKNAIQNQEEAIAQLKNNDPAAIADFLAAWDEAIATDKRITAFRNRSDAEKEAYRKNCKRKVENSRWNGEPERSEAQLIEDGRRRFRADMPRLFQTESYN